MLSHALEENDWAALDLAAFWAEWKWDGIRVQVVADEGETKLYSRSGDDISQQLSGDCRGFPLRCGA